jgi:hypothetical protein
MNALRACQVSGRIRLTSKDAKRDREIGSVDSRSEGLAKGCRKVHSPSLGFAAGQVCYCWNKVQCP